MNKHIAWIVGAIIVIALILFFATRNKSGDETTTPPSANSEVKSSGESTSLKNLLTSGGSKKCTFSFTDSGNGQGTVYTANGKMRNDSSFTASNQTYTSHMIVDGKTSYTWMDGQTTGYKMDFEAMQGNTMKGDVNNTGQTNVDPNKNMDFNCSNWSADNKMFELPSSIAFTDMSAMMNTGANANASGTMTGGVQDMEKACDQLAEPNRSQCKAAMQKR